MALRVLRGVGNRGLKLDLDAGVLRILCWRFGV